MPAIFSEKDKEELKARLIDAGWDALLAHGYRSLRIEDIAREAGIAKGTFYRFFASKEDFVREMVVQNRLELAESFDALCERCGGSPGRDAFAAWLGDIWHNHRAIFRCIDIEDYRKLKRVLPAKSSMGPDVGEDLMRELVSRVSRSNSNARIDVAAGLQKVIASMLLMREEFAPEVLEATVDAVVDATVRELFDDPVGKR